MNDLHIITVSTNNDFYFPNLQISCNINGKQLTTLGYGDEWKGFNWRYLKMIEYLKQLNVNDIVCFVDGYDVICVRNLQYLKDEFIAIKKKTNCKIIVGYDNHNLITKIPSLLYFSTCKNLLVNAGTYIGYVKDVLYVIEQIYNLNPNNDADDQILLSKYCNLYPDNIWIDYDGKIFLTLFRPHQEINDFVTINNNNEVIYNGNKPFFIHAPAGGYLDQLIINLNYDQNNAGKIKNKLFYKNINKIPYYFKEFCYNNYLLIILCILVIIIIVIIWNK